MTIIKRHLQRKHVQQYLIKEAKVLFISVPGDYTFRNIAKISKSQHAHETHMKMFFIRFNNEHSSETASNLLTRQFNLERLYYLYFDTLFCYNITKKFSKYILRMYNKLNNIKQVNCSLDVGMINSKIHSRTSQSLRDLNCIQSTNCVNFFLT